MKRSFIINKSREKQRVIFGDMYHYFIKMFFLPLLILLISNGCAVNSDPKETLSEINEHTKVGNYESALAIAVHLLAECEDPTEINKAKKAIEEIHKMAARDLLYIAQKYIKTGKEKDAIKTLKLIISTYPSTDSAIVAKNIIESIQM